MNESRWTNEQGHPELIGTTVRWVGRPARYADGALAQCVALAQETGATGIVIPTALGAVVCYTQSGRFVATREDARYRDPRLPRIA